MAYPYLQLTFQSQCLVSVEQYLTIVQPYITSTGALRVFNIGNDYWQIIPSYLYAHCPICSATWHEQIDTYSLFGWSGVSTTIRNAVYRSDGRQEIIEKFPNIQRCSHYMTNHRLVNLHSRLPKETNYFSSKNGEVPRLTQWAMLDDIESYAVLHALPLCRIEAGQFIPTYTLFILTYFSVDPQEVIRRHYAAEAEHGKGDPEYYPGGLDRADQRPIADPYYDLQAWATKGRLGYLDFTEPDLPLRIGAGTQLPAIYQKIPGARFAFTWRKGVFETAINGRRATQATIS